MPAADRDEPEHAKRQNQTRADLAALLRDVRAGELTSADFYERLSDIHGRHLGDDANSAANEMSRIRALRAFEGLTREAPSRHHELERLADALGISTP
jgi:hypothetical protein